MKKRPSYNLDLAIGMGEHARRMLVDFMNTRPEPAAFERFKKKWERRKRKPGDYELVWRGNFGDFREVQERVSEVWTGRKKGYESLVLDVFLGFLESTEEHPLPPPPIRSHWEDSSIYIEPRELREVVWLSLLEHSKQLGVCENHATGDCPTPYFLKYRPGARFCSEACAVTAQREAKLRWWRQHGKDWLKKRTLAETHQKGTS